MTPALTLCVAVVMQVVLVSMVLPGRVVRELRHRDVAFGRAQKCYAAYVGLNVIAAVLGLGLIYSFTTLNVRENLIQIFLLIGAYFFIQLSPLAMASVWRRWRDDEAASVDHLPVAPVSFFDVASPHLVGLAVFLFLAYLGTQAARWSGALDTHLLQTAIFFLTNLWFASAIYGSFSKLRNASAENFADRQREAYLITNLFLSISIMISLYYFSKKIFAGFDLHAYRPAAMSVAVQALAILLFNALFLNRDRGATA